MEIAHDTDVPFDKLMEYIHSERIPNVPGLDACTLINYEVDGNTVRKTVKRKLPITKIAAKIIGFSHVNLAYEIVFSEDTAVCRTKNPDCLRRYFEYSEELVFTRNENGTRVHRTAKTKNHVPPGVAWFFGSPEEEYHTKAAMYLQTTLDEATRL
jgi:hypothetical protein